MSRRSQLRVLVALTIVWAVWATWSLIGRASPYELVVLDDQGSPIGTAVVEINGDQAGATDSEGKVTLSWHRSSAVLEVSAPGHVSKTLTVSERPETPVQTILTARILRGRVVDQSGMGVPAALVTTGAASGLTDEEGRLEIRGAEPGVVSVERAAWQSTTFEWGGGFEEAEVVIEPFTARAVHISGESARDRLGEFIDMAKTTELNALMIDLKDESGLVWYDTDNPVAVEVGADYKAYDLASVVSRAHDEGLYVIGRLVLFNDPIAAVRKTSMAVWDSSTNAPFNANGQYFTDPTDPDARKYGLDLAVEACAAGVDEIQFDYVRFPDRRNENSVFDEGAGDEVRVATVSGFLTEAVEALRPMGCAVAADVFGFLTTHQGDGGIGQLWEEVASIVDVISPMLYPSHYDTGWYGFDTPNDHPGPMTTNALEDGMERLSSAVVVRPWLQDFGYTEDQVRAQINSAEQFGLGWMLWNARSDVTTGALEPG